MTWPAKEIPDWYTLQLVLKQWCVPWRKNPETRDLARLLIGTGDVTELTSPRYFCSQHLHCNFGHTFTSKTGVPWLKEGRSISGFALIHSFWKLGINASEGEAGLPALKPFGWICRA